MYYKILIKIVEQDAKGEIGSGTQYQLDITKGDELIETHQYSIMDIVTGKFDSEIIKFKYTSLNNDIFESKTKEREQQIKAKKEEQMNSKMSSVDNMLIAVIDDVIASNERLVDQYRNGNDKVLNALVGQTMKNYKGDPAVIKQLLIDKVKS